MNYKDKESFEKWFKDFYEVDFDAGNARFMGQLISWQAACEYKQKEISHHILKLEAENKKLREALDLIAGEQEFFDEISDRSKTMMAREALKETNDK